VRSLVQHENYSFDTQSLLRGALRWMNKGLGVWSNALDEFWSGNESWLTF